MNNKNESASRIMSKIEFDAAFAENTEVYTLPVIIYASALRKSLETLEMDIDEAIAALAGCGHGLTEVQALRLLVDPVAV